MRSPFTVPVIPADADASRHIFLWLTDYLFQTAGNVYYRAGRISARVNGDTVSSDGNRCK